MDTNVKKFKFSAVGKAVCVLLCLISFLVSSGLFAVSAMSYYYCKDGAPEKFTDSRAFSDVLVSSVTNTLDMAYYSGNENYYINYSNKNYNSRFIRCYAQSDGADSSYLSGYKISEKEALTHDIYFIYNAGEINSKGLSEYNISTIKAYCFTDDMSSTMSVYLYLDIPQSETTNIIDYISDYDVVIGLMDFYDTAVNCYNSLDLYLLFAVLTLIVSFVAGFVYLPTAGRKSDDNPAKSAFVDYIPLEIHLAVYFGIGYGVTAFAVNIISYFFLSRLTVVLVLICTAVIWLMLFEFCACVARCANSNKKFYKNFLIYHILKLIFIIIKKFFLIGKNALKALKRSADKTNNRTKNLLSALMYKPKMFKKNAIKITLLYILLNLAALFILYCFWRDWYTGYRSSAIFLIAAVLTALDLGINISLFKKILNYIQQLDTLIFAASRHEDAALNIGALPQSLKVLAESMSCTNTELQNAVAKAVKDERLKTELITNVSHDLKTPLTSIITYVDLLSKCDITDEKAKEYISVLSDKSAKLKRLIDDLIEASKINSGNITVNPSNLNLYELCLQATVESQKDFEKAGLELIVKESGDAPAIFADGSKSFRIIENLLSNAKKYSAKNTRVYVSVYQENGMGVFEIKNISAQPLDISPDELTQRFVRGDKSRNQEGNGLGLSIAKELCKAQNGSLEISIDGDLFKAKVKLPLSYGKEKERI